MTAPPGLRVEGEVDAGTRAAFSQVLRTAVGRARQDLHVDLSRLQHIDLGGLRVLAAAANALDGELTLVLAPLPSRLRRLIELAGWDDVEKLRMGPEPSGRGREAEPDTGPGGPGGPGGEEPGGEDPGGEEPGEPSGDTRVDGGTR
ncbi:STAS domain-containing protein [Actinomadura sp. 21ATH]|uniref:STAS domain-containing protein n=1 Tax=Actinomadura sp. 21ATH TaxID=1735444 RepID=UPI0035BFF046